MPEWDGPDRPPLARDPAPRHRSGQARTSLLSVPGAVGAEAAGFTPVGEVMGAVVHRVGWAGPSRWAADRIRVLADLLRQGYETALDRLEEEAAGLGADGVLGIRLTRTTFDGEAQEYVALGTAVRAGTKQRPHRPFTTDLPGQDVAKLIQAGWVPVRVAIGVDGQAMTNSNFELGYSWSMLAGVYDNAEIDLPTALATQVRAAARAEFAREIGECGADGGIVSGTTFDLWPVEDVAAAAIATVTGTAIARFREGIPHVGALTILPLNRDLPD
ncbi:heavy metal-binding domain-containing protein [Amycolatopsis sp., V23-08]|uniref:Heavy metal-binding domain-containing protein n=1 Tax=Amycolatopsis heterodermiae TaxID=3110235 RepID=A0ABU5RDM9_9PSEU|nr:heavy metal-binding domain-containing protein [Amycolatopsis sp., V23-08]MEA5364376.1 heavy metal-binding domain-containing protein [Amycolatopsis sp., V23-08]